ncbi:phage tail tube protein [uncultured Maritimibacter sp.]|uniref:phage tail tube protein n=1 Tax=uncultured Maritimibacter sp. TaxID=991866 RepID=UPI0026047496|nr:phage tail tube protein [uncultured Maritimibacter sp.]
MTTNAMLALGAFAFSTDGGTTWEPFIEPKAAPVPAVEIDYKEVTSLDSEGWREYIPGLKDGGEVEVQSNYTRAGYTALAAIDATKVMFKSTFANDDAFTFDGIPITTPDTVDVGEPETMTTRIKVSGAVTFAAGA